MSKLPILVSAKYFRLYFERHIIGFKRTLVSKKGKRTIEYLTMAGDGWTRKEILHDMEIPLSTPPIGISTLPRTKVS